MKTNLLLALSLLALFATAMAILLCQHTVCPCNAKLECLHAEDGVCQVQHREQTLCDGFRLQCLKKAGGAWYCWDGREPQG